MVLSEEARLLRNAYMREYKKKNKEKIQSYNASRKDQNREAVARYWEKKAQRIKEGE